MSIAMNNLQTEVDGLMAVWASRRLGKDKKK
jgi:hypothetical protein